MAKKKFFFLGELGFGELGWANLDWAKPRRPVLLNLMIHIYVGLLSIYQMGQRI